LQYDEVRDELLADGIGLKMISIGKPEVGASLCDHLGVKDCSNFLFADPENKLYNDLELNKGVDVTFFNPATPFAIKDRLFKKDGMKRLNEVLGKWSGGKIYRLVLTSLLKLEFVGASSLLVHVLIPLFCGPFSISILHSSKARASIQSGRNICFPR